ncbi:MAG: hypothetical protein ACREJD_01105 [Phycisphaerales bacterium]
MAEDTGPASTRYWIDPRDKPGLLRETMQFLAGDAHVSFEGNLSRCAFPAPLKPSAHETQALCRSTVSPKLDFAVLSLEPDAIGPILEVILPDWRYLDDIIHIQIERGGKLQFGSYDNFHRECVVCHAGVETSLLDKLKSSGVIRSWQVAPADEHRWHD